MRSRSPLFPAAALPLLFLVGGCQSPTTSSDTLDVWIDSGSSSRAVIAQRPELHGKQIKEGDEKTAAAAAAGRRAWCRPSR